MPPIWMQRLLWLLVPPACREHVLGDLQERYKSMLSYLADALRVLPPVIVSRICRTTDWQVFAIEVLTVYLAFAVRRPDLVTAFLLPSATVGAALLFCNAYSDLDKPSFARPILQSAGCIGLSFAARNVHPIPLAAMLSGSFIGFMLLTTLRMWFPPQQARPKLAAIQARRMPGLPVKSEPDWNQIRTVMTVLAVSIILFEFISTLARR